MLGSFASAMVYRIPLGKSWIWNAGKDKAARSACPYCHHVLTMKDLIPFFSWLRQQGRCRYCQEKISPQYIALEVGSVLIAVSIYFLSGFRLESFILLALVPFVLSQIILLFRDKMISKQLGIIIMTIGVFYVLFAR